MNTLVIASDHGGYSLKSKLIPWLSDNYKVLDMGPSTQDSVDYPDFADKAIAMMFEKKCKGILICGSGQGMAMRANKHSGIRAALCWNKEIAVLSREHNDANVLCLGGRFTNESDAKDICSAFLETQFFGERHIQRVKKIDLPTNKLK